MFFFQKVEERSHQELLLPTNPLVFLSIFTLNISPDLCHPECGHFLVHCPRSWYFIAMFVQTPIFHLRLCLLGMYYVIYSVIHHNVAVGVTVVADKNRGSTMSMQDALIIFAMFDIGKCHPIFRVELKDT